MSCSSSPVPELAEDILNAMKGILSDDENSCNTQEEIISGVQMSPSIANSKINLLAKANIDAAPLQSKAMDIELTYDVQVQLNNENCETSLLNNINPAPFQSLTVMFDFDSDDSLADPNYKTTFDSECSDETPVAKKSKNYEIKRKKRVNEKPHKITSTLTINIENPATPTNRELNKNTPPSRKRKKNESLWKCNVRRVCRQKGQSYIDILGNAHAAKSVKLVKCSCRFRCCSKFDETERQLLHEAFWRLHDKAKNHYYAQFVQRTPVKRKTKKHPVKKREFSYCYFFKLHDELIRVCQAFFLKTLDISSRRIQWFFANKFNEVTGIATSPTKGKHIKKKIPNNKLDEVRNHIKSFPRMESHYCRENTQKEYLGSNLSIQKMYNLYKESCEGTPVKGHMYSKTFNEEFNCAFHLPKKDQCDLCAQFKNKPNLNDADQTKFSLHENNKIHAKSERDKDRKNKDENTAIITYDLENVFALPKAEISNFYYKRKFAVYNLTGHCNLNKTTYCSLWTEAQSGRAGNDISSALYKILKTVVQDLQTINKIVLWSDSCVAQNKNRVNTTMILKFLQENPKIEAIIHKYSEPGHSQLQEIDSVHSAIERHLRGVTIYSPVTLLQQLKKINYDRVHLKIMQLKDVDFYNFNLASKIFTNMLPFLKARIIQYKSEDLGAVDYKCTLSATEPFTNIKLFKNSKNNIPKIVVKPLKFNWAVSEEKKKNIKSMMKYMDKVDVDYYNAVLNKQNDLDQLKNVIPKPRRALTKVITPRSNKTKK